MFEGQNFVAIRIVYMTFTPQINTARVDSSDVCQLRFIHTIFPVQCLGLVYGSSSLSLSQHRWTSIARFQIMIYNQCSCRPLERRPYMQSTTENYLRFNEHASYPHPLQWSMPDRQRWHSARTNNLLFPSQAEIDAVWPTDTPNLFYRRRSRSDAESRSSPRFACHSL